MSDDQSKHEPEKKERKLPPHEKHVIGRVHLNNIDLSHHAKHDWRPAHEAQCKAFAEKAAKKKAAKTTQTESQTITVRSYFQTLGLLLTREERANGEWVPANTPELDPPERTLLGVFETDIDVSTTVDNTTVYNSLKDLLDKLQEEYEEEEEGISEVTYKIENTIPPPYYILSITGKGFSTFSYANTSDEDGYDPDPDLMVEGQIASWAGNAWMYFEGEYIEGVTVYDPTDNTPFNPEDPGHDVHGYPEATVDEYKPLTLLPHVVEDNIWIYEVTFSYEGHAFSFIYEPQEFDGVTHMVMVIRPMRWRRKK
jgi:hypothetical protein